MVLDLAYQNYQIYHHSFFLSVMAEFENCPDEKKAKLVEEGNAERGDDSNSGCRTVQASYCLRLINAGCQSQTQTQRMTTPNCRFISKQCCLQVA